MAEYHQMWKMIERNSFEMDADISVFVTCIICDKLLIDACEGACGCIYYRKCIDQLITDQEIKICPSGKDQCKKNGHNFYKTLKINNHINKQISLLQVKCPSNACKYNCALINMVDHLKTCDKLPTISSFNIKMIKKVDSSRIHFEWIKNLKDKLAPELADVMKLIDSRISATFADFPSSQTDSKNALGELQQEMLTMKQKINQIMFFIDESTNHLEKKILHCKETNYKLLNSQTKEGDQQHKEEEEEDEDTTEITFGSVKLIKEIIQLEEQKITNENEIHKLKKEFNKQSRELKHIKDEEHEIRRELYQLKKDKHQQTKEINQIKREKEKLLAEIKILEKEKQWIPMVSVKQPPNQSGFMTTNTSNLNNGVQLIGSFNCPFNKISRIDTDNGSDKFYFSNNSIEIWLRMWPNGCRRGFHKKDSNNICIDYLLDDGIIRHEDEKRRFPRTYLITLTLRPKAINTDNCFSSQQKVDLDGSNSYQKIFAPSQFHFLKSDLNSKNIIKNDCVILECDVELVHL